MPQKTTTMKFQNTKYVQPAPTKAGVPQAVCFCFLVPKFILHFVEWTPEEEAQLTALVEKYGNDWDRVAANMSRSRGAVSGNP